MPDEAIWQSLSAAAIVVASSATDLATKVPAPADGQIAVIRLGAGRDAEDIALVYNAARSKWVGEEDTVIRTTDQSPCAVQSLFTTKQYAVGAAANTYWSLRPIRHAALCAAAGLTLEYQLAGFLALDSSLHAINVGAMIWQYNTGDSSYANPYAKPPVLPDATLVAETDYLNGGAANPNWQWQEIAWATLAGPLAQGAVTGAHSALGTINKTTLYPLLYYAMDAGATAGGNFIDVTLKTRWVI